MLHSARAKNEGGSRGAKAKAKAKRRVYTTSALVQREIADVVAYVMQYEKGQLVFRPGHFGISVYYTLCKYKLLYDNPRQIYSIYYIIHTSDESFVRQTGAFGQCTLYTRWYAVTVGYS